MPTPVVLPKPPSARARFEPLLAQEASYLAASARMRSFCCTSIFAYSSMRRSDVSMENRGQILRESGPCNDLITTSLLGRMLEVGLHVRYIAQQTDFLSLRSAF